MGTRRLNGNKEVEWEQGGQMGTRRLNGNKEVKWEQVG